VFDHRCSAVCRITQQETQVGPYRVPEGVIVFPCLYSILMHSANWDQPTEVRPSFVLHCTTPGLAGFTPCKNACIGLVAIAC
jgi:hypothetical protein